MRALLNAIMLKLVGYAFGARLSATPGEAALALLALVLAILGVLGFGLMAAAMFTLINAKGASNPVSWLIGVLQGLVTGAYFPIDALPQWLQVLAKTLPQTYAIDAARRLLLDSPGTASLVSVGGLTPLASDFAILAGFAVTLPAIGAWVFAVGLRKAQADGGLSRWA